MKAFILLLLTFSISLSDTLAHPSWGIVVDKQRNIYFTDISHNGRGSVWKLTREGKLELLLSDFHAHNVSLASDGSLITAHGEENHTMVRIHPDGRKDTLYTTRDYTEFNGGSATWSPKGEILFGAKKFIWRIVNAKKEKVSEHQFEWNQSVYVDEEGNIYGPDIGRDQGCLVKISPDGLAETLATHLITTKDGKFDPHQDVLLGITKGCDNHMYIAETAGQRIIRIVQKDEVETFYTSEADWFPTAIDFFAGDAYIMEYRFTKTGMAGPQIVKINEAGEKSVLLNYEEYQEQNPIAPLPYQPPFSLWLIVSFLSLATAVSIVAWQHRKSLRLKTSM